MDRWIEVSMQFGKALFHSMRLTGLWDLDLIFLSVIVLTFVLVSYFVKARVCIVGVLLPGWFTIAASKIIVRVYLGRNDLYELLAVGLALLLLVVPLTRRTLKVSWVRSIVVWAVTLGVMVFLSVPLVQKASDRGYSVHQPRLDKNASSIRKMLSPKEK